MYPRSNELMNNCWGVELELKLSVPRDASKNVLHLLTGYSGVQAEA
jgi:hypothetical protein